jgi:hypothetical protein
MPDTCLSTVRTFPITAALIRHLTNGLQIKRGYPTPPHCCFFRNDRCNLAHADLQSGVTRRELWPPERIDEVDDSERKDLALSNTRPKESALAPAERHPSPELTANMAQEHHVLYPPRSVEIRIRPGCQSISKPVAPGQSGPVAVVVLGEDDLDVNEIELSSVKFADAPLVSASVSDVNLDGKPDLIAIFDMAGMKLHPGATSARVTGWLKNSQIFTGAGRIAVVPRMDMQDASCRQ